MSHCNDENEIILTARSILISKICILHDILKELGLKLILARDARPPKYVFDGVNELQVLSNTCMTDEP